MLKILSSAQIKDLDAATIQHDAIPSIDLMERACQSFVNWFAERFDSTKKIGIICGTGNNGGDGLGIARILNEWGYSVKVWIVPGKESADFAINRERLRGKVNLNEFSDATTHEDFSDRDILMDAIFGSGLSRPVEGIYKKAIEALNAHRCLRIAVDVPSGLLADAPSAGSITKADCTVSFQLPKLAFLFPENHKFVGDWCLVDIGLSKSFIKEAKSQYYYLAKKSVKKILKSRSTFDHKGDHGKALLIAGSYGKMGAGILSSRACLRAGVGLLTVHVPGLGYQIIQSSVPEAMASVDKDDKVFSECPLIETFDVVGIGPGIGKTQETVKAFKKVLTAGKPMVVDADGLNIISENRELLHSIPAGSILTPHPKEFERMVGSWKNDFERLEKQIHLARETKSVVVLKGAHTSIAVPDGTVYFNSTGNPGMATGGTGDVLTGILTGLLAQKYSAESAAILGVYLHGFSGDIAAREKSVNSLIASDLIDFLPSAFRQLL
ncbi:bifunctional ADP-dependent NAD(P)H-hydrate dehydratase/NAD(P)H-hydrate epimerase [soil metagenome]